MSRELCKFINENLVFLIFVPNIISYLLFAWDKHLAHYQRSRVPEAILFLFTFLMGAFGALCGMIFFRHKTRHVSFLAIVPVMAILQVAFYVVFKLFLQK